MVFSVSEHNCPPLITDWDKTHNVGWERGGTMHAPLPAAQTAAASTVSVHGVHAPRTPDRHHFFWKPKEMYLISSNYLREKSLYYINRSGFILPNWNWKYHPTDLTFMEKRGLQTAIPVSRGLNHSLEMILSLSGDYKRSLGQLSTELCRMDLTVTIYSNY